MMNTEQRLTVQAIPAREVKPWILRRHYAKRSPCIQYAFGLFDGVACRGIVTYGTPPSVTLQEGLCGKEYAGNVLELNRLCVSCNEHNATGQLVGGSLQLLPKPSIIVSYADTAQGHIGIIYQATNFIYTGLSAAINDLRHTEDVHETGHDLRLSAARGGKTRGELLEDGAKVVARSRKYRYVYFVGNKRQRRKMRSALRYDVLPYPRGETARYDATAEIESQRLLF